MIAGQNIDAHSYAGSYASSLAFGDEDTNAQSAYKVNILGFKHIPRCLSKDFSDFGDMNIDDLSHNDIKSEVKAYKCFKCFGIKGQLNSSGYLKNRQEKCRQCDDSEYISESHPIIAIMEQIIKKRIPYLPKKMEQQKIYDNRRQTLQLEYGCSNVIKQQSFSCQEQLTPYCRACNKQCDQNGYRICQKCEDFNICQECFKKNRFSHHHPLIIKDLNRLHSKMMEISQNAKNASHQQNILQLQNDFENTILKCCSCNQLIDVCYETCIDCQEIGVKYNICNGCSQNNIYRHNPMHRFDMRTIAQASQLNRFDSINSTHIQNLQLNSQNNSNPIGNNIKQSIVRFNNYFMNSSFQDSQNRSSLNFGRDSLRQQIRLNFSDHLLDDDIAIKNQFQQGCQKGLRRQSKRIEVSERENSLMGIDMSSSLQFSKKEQSQPHTATFIPIFNSITSDSLQKYHKNPEEQFIFNGYQCDICGVEPIRKKRFHCRECEDYDLCQSCYIVRSNLHQHINFQEINGSMLFKQRNSMFQLNQLKVLKSSILLKKL